MLMWRFEAPNGSHREHIVGPIVMFLVFLPVVWWARDSMTKTRINRSLVSAAGLTLAAQTMLHIGTAMLGVSAISSGVLNLFLWGVSVSILAAAIERRLALAAAGFFIAFFVACAHPAWRWYAMSASNAVLMLTMAWVWGIGAVISWRSEKKVSA